MHYGPGLTVVSSCTNNLLIQSVPLLRGVDTDDRDLKIVLLLLLERIGEYEIKKTIKYISKTFLSNSSS